LNIQIGNIIKKTRKQNGLTLKDLSLLTGLSISYLSLLERGMNHPTVENLNTVCGALNIALPDLISESTALDDLVVRKDRRRILLQGHGFKYEAATNGKDFLSCIIITITDDKEYVSKPHISDEVGYIISGTYISTVNGVSYELNPGDTMYIRANSSHSYRRKGSEPCVSIWVSTQKSQNRDMRRKARDNKKNDG